MSELEEPSIPQAAETEVTGQQSAVPQDSYVLPPEDRRGGEIKVENLPDAIAQIASRNSRGLGSGPSLALLLGWATELYKSVESAKQFQQTTIGSLEKIHGELTEEKVNRVVAETKLNLHEKFHPLKAIVLAAGVALFGLAIDRLNDPKIGYPLLVIAVVLVVVAVASGRSKL